MDKSTPNSPNLNRRSIRLKGYDYASEGCYFITLVTHNREPLFGEIVDAEMHLNKYGKIVEHEWLRSAEIRREIELDEFIIMPNHFHGIIHIVGTGDQPVAPTSAPVVPTNQPGPPAKSIGAFMAGFKSSVTKQINTLRNTPSEPVWQRNYYEHIISGDREYDQIANYIFNNPLNWNVDEENNSQKLS